MNLEYDNAKSLDLARALGNPNAKDVPSAIEFIFNRIMEMNTKLNIPHNLSEVVKEQDLDELSHQAKNDLCEPRNPKPVTQDDIKKLYVAIRDYKG